jgi:hypothetical protein
MERVWLSEFLWNGAASEQVRRGSEEQANYFPHASAKAFKWLSDEHGPNDEGVNSGEIPGPRR